MQQTTNYNLNLPEGTDVVNPLIDYNPNFSTIDSAMKANADRTVGRATCVKSGTTHVVTRSNTGSNIINFTATGDWNTGDTMTIDSTVVSVFLPDGSAALDGAYLINTEVFGILNGTRFTLYSNVVDIPAQTAANTSYDNTSSGLTANNVQGAIDEVNAKINKGFVNVVADGLKTYAALLTELFALIDRTKVNRDSVLEIGSTVCHMTSISTAYGLGGSYAAVDGSSSNIVSITIGQTGSAFFSTSINAGSNVVKTSNVGGGVPAAGIVIKFTY